MLGTLRYMSPEQATGQRGVLDQRTDIYSLGITLYELLTLQPAYPSTDRRMLLKEVLHDDPRPPRQLNPSIPHDLETIILKAIEKVPQSRYASAQALMDDLRRFLENRPVTARRPSLFERGVRFTKRNKAAVISAAIGLLIPIIILCVLGVLSAKERATRQKQQVSQVNRALEDAAMLRGKAEESRDNPDKWYAALSAARRAASLLEAGETDTELEKRTALAVEELDREWNLAKSREEQTILDQWMLQELEQIQIEQTNVKDGNFDISSGLPKYIAAFQTYGIDLEKLSPEEAARRIRSRAIRAELVAVIDRWSMLYTANDPRRSDLLTIAQLADSEDEFRHQLRTHLLSDVQNRVVVTMDPKLVASQTPQSILMAVGLLNEDGRRTEALELLRAAQIRHPSNFWINTRLGYHVEEPRTSTVDEKLHYYTVAVALRPQSAGAWNNFGLGLNNAGQREDAVAAIREAIRLKPDFVEAHHHLGTTLSGLSRTDEAILAFREAIRLRPDYPEGRYHLGIALGTLGRTDEAIQAFREANRLRPDFPEGRYNLGIALGKLGRWDEAIQAFREAIRLKPDFLDARHNLGVALGKFGRWDEVIQVSRETIRLKPDFHGAHHDLGIALIQLGRWDEAIPVFQEAIRLRPDDPELHLHLAIALRKLTRRDEAILAFREAIRLKPDYPEAHHELGIALGELGRLDEAIQAFQEAIRLKPDYPDAHHNLGIALGTLGRWDDAIQVIREAIRLKPDYPKAHYKLGLALCTLGRWDEAVQAFREAIRLKPDYPEAHYRLGLALGELGRLDEAIQAFREAIRLKPDYPEAHCNLGRALETQGKFLEALPRLQLGHELGMQKAGWRFPSAEWVKRCQHLIALDQRLTEILDDSVNPVSLSECLSLASFCVLTKKQHYAAAVRFYEEAFRLQPDLLLQVNSHCYNAACAAILATSVQADDEKTLDDSQKNVFRNKALNWLQAELQRLNSLRNEGQSANSLQLVTHWQSDSDLASIRDPKLMALLPEDERHAWQQFWSHVDQLKKELLAAAESEADKRKVDSAAARLLLVDPLTDSLYKVDPSSGAATVAGPLGFPASSIAGLAYAPQSHTLYYSGLTRVGLYRIDLGNGRVIKIGDLAHNIPGLAYDAKNKVLYGISGATDSLYSINPANATLTRIGPLGVNVTRNGLAFDSQTGVLYMVNESDDNLYSVNPQTGEATTIGPVGEDLNINGLTSFSGRLYGVSGTADSLYELSKSSGTARRIGSLGVDVDVGVGLASIPVAAVSWKPAIAEKRPIAE